MIGAAARALLAGIVDYAGLFPPAGLDMRSAVGNYARYLASEDAWALGRLVVPAARLEEFAAAKASLSGQGAAAAEWRLSATLGADVPAELDRVRRFNRAHAGLGVVDVVEAQLDSAEAIASTVATARGLDLFVEVPVREDPKPLLQAVRDGGAKAKIRTGGITPDAFPPTEAVARFLRGCRELGLAFKATAGLHHPVRGLYPLTYEAGAACATMYGFLNVLVAAALVANEAGDEAVCTALEWSDAAAVRVESDAIELAGARVGAGELRGLRERFAISFGSCSFREPMDELRAAGLL